LYVVVVDAPAELDLGQSALVKESMENIWGLKGTLVDARLLDLVRAKLLNLVRGLEASLQPLRGQLVLGLLEQLANSTRTADRKSSPAHLARPPPCHLRPPLWPPLLKTRGKLVVRPRRVQAAHEDPSDRERMAHHLAGN
jgi:hypothetical protein